MVNVVFGGGALCGQRLAVVISLIIVIVVIIVIMVIAICIVILIVIVCIIVIIAVIIGYGVCVYHCHHCSYHWLWCYSVGVLVPGYLVEGFFISVAKDVFVLSLPLGSSFLI